jgi:predicted ATPase
VRVDLLELRQALAAQPAAALPLGELERLAGEFRGDPLEGLDLPDFDAYQAWCVAQRDEARALHSAVLGALVDRLVDDPVRAVEHARRRVQLDPHDVAARAALIRVLGALGRRDEAAWHQVDSAAAAPAAAPGLIGRDAELGVLDARLARGAPGFAAVLVTGEPGAGKSRLLGAWGERARERALVFSARAFEADAGRPYAPWLEILRALPGARAELPRADSEQALFDGVAAELVQAADAAPLVAVLDDVQWLDPGSAALLLHLARAAADRPITVVLGARTGEVDDNAALGRALRGLRQLGAVTELHVAPLAADAIAALVRSVDARADVDRIHAQSRGNPLFALELARAGAAALAAPPASITAAIRDRVDALPEAAATVLRWGAVLERGLSAEELAALAGLDEDATVDAIELLERRALLAGDGFAHELVRRAVYAALSEPRRRLMHRRIAQWLARRNQRGEVDVALVAHHAALAHDSALAAETCLGAGRRSLRVFATADAHALARRGLRHAESLADPDRTRRQLELFEVVLAARRPDEVEPVARQVEALAERALDLDCLEHARLGYHLLAWLRWETGAWSDARRFMLQAQLVSRGAGEAEQIVGMAEAARCLVLLEKDLGQAQALALEARARGRAAGVEPSATFAALGMLHLHQGELDDARADLERAVALARAVRDHHDEFQALEQLVQLELERGDHVAAAARATELVELGARFRDGSEAPFAAGLAALVRIARGDDAEAELDAAAETLARVDAKSRLAYLLSRAAWLDVERGAPARAVRRAGAALAAASAVERTTEAALARAVLARVAASDDGEAAAHLAAIAGGWDRISAPVRARVAPLLGRSPAATEEEP